MKKLTFQTMLIALAALFFSCTCKETETQALEEISSKNLKVMTSQSQESEQKPLITFIELGSVNCIPCRMMQPVMESVTKKYGKQIEVIFYDVWKPEQRHYAQQYGIRVIPTQVFLNSDGKEIYRHEGFFPEPELDKFLQARGLKPVTEG